MANIAQTDIILTDPRPDEVLTLAEELRDEYPYLTATIISGEYVCIDTKWKPATDLALAICERLQADATIVWSELGNHGVGCIYVQHVEGVQRASQTFTHDTPTSLADIQYIIATEPLLADHVSFMEEDYE